MTDDLDRVSDLCLNYQPIGLLMSKQLTDLKNKLDDAELEIRLLNERLSFYQRLNQPKTR